MNRNPFHLPSLVFVLAFSVLSPVVHAQQTPDISAIQEAMDASEYNAALQMCVSGIKAQPDQVELYRLQAQALRNLDRVDEIPAALADIISRHPRNADLFLSRALAFKSLGQLDRMIGDCTRLIQLGEGLGFVLAAQWFEAKGDKLQGIRCYTRLMEIYPDSDEMANWQFARAQLFAALNVFDWAFADVNASIEAKPEPLKLLLLGEIQARCENWDKAEEALQSFNTMTDQHYVGEVRRLNVLMDMNQIDKVEFLLGEYDKKYENTDRFKEVNEIRKALAARLALNEQIKQAAMRQNSPNGFETAEEMTAGQERMKQLSKATDPGQRQELKLLLIRHAQLGMYHTNVGYADVMMKTLKNLKSKFTLTAQDQARETTVQAWLQMQANEYQQAEASALKAIKLDPGYADAYRVSASILFMQDQNQSALKAANNAVELDSLNAVNFGYRGLINTNLGNIQEAAADLAQANRLAPDNSWIAGLLAKFTNAIGNTDFAVTYLCRPLKGDYTAKLLDRCELFLEAQLPQLAFPDAAEYAQAAGDTNAEQVASVKARAAFMWYDQTLHFETGGPNIGEVVDACLEAEALLPEASMFPYFRSQMLRRNGDDSVAIVAANKALGLGANNAELFHHLASLQLKVGDIAGAMKTSQTIQSLQYEDAASVATQKELVTMVKLAAGLERRLQELEFQSQTGAAIGQLLATSEDLSQLFETEHAKKLDAFYDSIRSRTEDASVPKENTQLRLECIRSSDVASQDPTIFGFDSSLADIAGLMNGDHYWFTVRYSVPGEMKSQSFAYFVKLKNGWKSFPRPWGQIQSSSFPLVTP